MFCSIRIPYPYAYHCWSALMTGFLSITFSSLDRFMYYTTVRCCFISLCSKAFKDRFVCPALRHSASLLRRILVPLRFHPLGCPFLWGRDCKGSNLFSSDQIRRKKSPVPETDSFPFASFATCGPPRLAEPLFLSCDCKGNNLFSSDQIFREKSFLFPKTLSSSPLHKQIFFKSDYSKDSGGTSCSENPYRIPRLGIKKRSATTLRLYRLPNRAALAWAATLRSGCVCKGNTFFAENNTPLHFYRLIPPQIAPYSTIHQQLTSPKMSYQQQSNL